MNPQMLDMLDAIHAWFHRKRWWIRLALTAVLVPWFGRFAYLRMTTPPADPKGLSSPFTLGPPPQGMTKTLLDAIPDPLTVSWTAPATAPAGKQWVATNGMDTTSGATHGLDPIVACSGPWNPQGRYHLQQIIAWLETPSVEASLSQLTAAVSQPFHLDIDPLGSLIAFRSACKTLCAHARYSMAQKHDFKTAVRDVRAILDICCKLEDDGTLIRHLVSIACRDLIYGEITCWSRDFDLTRAQSGALISVLDDHRVDLQRQWSVVLHAENRLFESTLDGCYTRGADGNGWFVPRFNPQTADDTVLQVLNLLSPLVADRRTLLHARHLGLNRAIEAASLPYQQAVRQMSGRNGVWISPRPEWPENPLYGPIQAANSNNITASAYGLLTQKEARHAAAIASLALSVYRTEHGRFPDHLSELAPDYIQSLPLDPITGKPLCYRLDKQDGYSLYSVGENGMDDGGQIWKEQNGKRELMAGTNTLDWIFPGIRHEADQEWFLVPTTQPAGGGANVSGE